jgi:predicted transglutaminase-like cysteine proteinase
MFDVVDLQAILSESNACARYERERDGGDVWQTPAELSASGAGDCEDFAIDAWARAKAAGYTARVAWCLRQDADARRSHMVCLVREDADPWVLDVVADAVCRLSERPDLAVVLEMDDAGVYIRDVRRPVSTIQQWADVLGRMRINAR